MNKLILIAINSIILGGTIVFINRISTVLGIVYGIMLLIILVRSIDYFLERRRKFQDEETAVRIEQFKTDLDCYVELCKHNT